MDMAIGKNMAANMKLYPEKVFDIQFDLFFPYRQMSFFFFFDHEVAGDRGLFLLFC